MQKSIIFLSLFFIISCAIPYAESAPKTPSSKKIVMIIAHENFRDEEYKVPKELFEKNNITVVTASSCKCNATGMQGLKVSPSILIENINVNDYSAVIFVGGSGAVEYWDSKIAHNIALKTIKANKILGAICIAPVTLAKAGVLKNKKATVFSSEKDKLEAGGAIYTGKAVEKDGNIVTANGPDAADEFAKEILKGIK